MKIVVDRAHVEDRGLIHVEMCLTTQQSANMLHAQYCKRLKNGNSSSPMGNALWDGYWALKLEAEKQADYAKACGHLLFCFDGTTALRRQEVAA